jgi:putative hemolysin
MMPVDELPRDADDYDTVGGLFLAQLVRIPSVGDKFEWKDLRFEVVDMDGHRVDKVLITPLKPTTQ